MKKEVLSPKQLQALAEAWRKHPGFGSPYWHEGRWVWLSPHGDARSKCGSPIEPPAPDAVKPHEKTALGKVSHLPNHSPLGWMRQQNSETRLETLEAR